MCTTPRCAVPHRPTLPIALALALALVMALAPAPIAAQHDHSDGHDDHDQVHSHDGLHFTHPMFTESVSPDAKVRLDYGRLNGPGAENEAELEGEWAFASWFSIEAGIHYHLDDGSPGTSHVLFKLANPSLHDAGVHLGYGLEVVVPTAAHEEHDHAVSTAPDPESSWHVTPFADIGWTNGTLELVGWTLLDVPTDEAVRETAGTVLRFNTSALYHLGARVDGLLEAFGRTALSGTAPEPGAIDIAPGLRVRPLDAPLVLGAGVAVPVTGREYDTRLLVSAFWHF